MSEDLDTARRYRLHAEELRVIADGMESNPQRDVLLEVARDYESMAKSLEALAGRDPGPITASLH